MQLYKAILAGRVEFPKHFKREARDLISKLLQVRDPDLDPDPDPDREGDSATVMAVDMLCNGRRAPRSRARCFPRC